MSRKSGYRFSEKDMRRRKNLERIPTGCDLGERTGDAGAQQIGRYRIVVLQLQPILRADKVPIGLGVAEEAIRVAADHLIGNLAVLLLPDLFDRLERERIILHARKAWARYTFDAGLRPCTMFQNSTGVPPALREVPRPK